ncbi:ADP-ribose pyrophosphatase YjhB (NUDIX family) [Arthrobacter sp. B3I9]|uniref:NUDIX hydrolase n=1 Tax=Arthrobacter sp. B3I9 TaxID=3042270 RepID=UPI002791FBD2|nr:NUDIX hydrolase [Arthrobacter sp. B3I9]MDQ0851100.1 ADP-ribose pyrophosphatase YjhB (NUDIX family) [Arthrobacter sp. B3I9]
MKHEVKQIRERLAYSNPFIELYDDDVEFPDGTTGRYVRLRATMPGAPVVLVAMHEGRIALVRTFRYPLGQLVWELPRGFSQGVSVEDTARNELREELGISSADIEVIGFLAPDSGVQSIRAAVVAATVRAPGQGPEDINEVESIGWVTLQELEQMIRRGQVEDSFTVAACTLIRLHERL